MNQKAYLLCISELVQSKCVEGNATKLQCSK